jgi:hypothetical protein
MSRSAVPAIEERRTNPARHFGQWSWVAIGIIPTTPSLSFGPRGTVKRR